MNQIHPSAVIAQKADIADDVIIRPNCVIAMEFQSVPVRDSKRML